MQDIEKHLRFHKERTLNRIKDSAELRSLLEMAYKAAAADGIHIWNCTGKDDDEAD